MTDKPVDFDQVAKELLVKAMSLDPELPAVEVIKKSLRLYCAQRTRGIPWQVRFWNMVNKSKGCWEWQGGLNHKGYGLFRGPNSNFAHRISWFIENGDIPDGMEIMHSCDNRRCVNPSHLSPGTHKQNMVDMSQKGRSPRKGIGNPKLTHADVSTIREAVQNGIPVNDLAVAYRVCPATIKSRLIKDLSCLAA